MRPLKCRQGDIQIGQQGFNATHQSLTDLEVQIIALSLEVGRVGRHDAPKGEGVGQPQCGAVKVGQHPLVRVATKGLQVAQEDVTQSTDGDPVTELLVSLAMHACMLPWPTCTNSRPLKCWRISGSMAKGPA